MAAGVQHGCPREQPEDSVQEDGWTGQSRPPGHQRHAQKGLCFLVALSHFFKQRIVADLLLTSRLGCFRCLGLFRQIPSESVNPAMAQEKPFYSASTLTSR